MAELGILPGETVRLTLTFENTLKRRRRKKAPKCALISLCQQLDFRADSMQADGALGQKSVTLALKSVVSWIFSFFLRLCKMCYIVFVRFLYRVTRSV